ncbi:hypothetical protein, partial [Kordia zhangzhouensis]|uniref:hypothetical protein n=1 Tax=Kordia zhangzhouensis TaxID=1620405 RepID=UPI0012F8E9E0
ITATMPSSYSVCDDTNGNDTDGLGTFDLSTLDTQILGGLVGTATVSYHGSLADAQTNVNPLSTVYTNMTPSVETIYARVEDNVTGCFDVVEAILIVDPLPNLDNIPPMVA